MASSYSVRKRGNIYYLRHRITPDGRLVAVSLRTNEQREAYRRAKQLVREAELQVAQARLRAEPSPEIEAWGQELQEADPVKAEQMVAEWLGGMKEWLDRQNAIRKQEREEERAAQKAERQRKTEELKRQELDLTNPRLDRFWHLAPNKEDDSGLYIDWCRDGNRSPNTLVAYRSAWTRFRDYFPEIDRIGDITPDVINQVHPRFPGQTPHTR